MPLPGIFITFQSAAAAAIARSEKGTVALMIRDAMAADALQHLMLTRAAQIPATLSKGNQAYIRRAFMGYVNPPRTVLVCVLPEGAADLTGGLDWAATQQFDYLCAPPDVTPEQAQVVASWVKAARTDKHMVKAVLPNLAADAEGIVNFAAADIKVGGDTFTAGEYCSRIAGLIAGTPMEISCTFAPLPEVEDIARLSSTAADAAVDAGKLILIHDGVKVKMARGVNSFVTTTQSKGDVFRKIKIIELLDMIQTDLRQSVADSYIGKYANSYDNKLVLVTAIKAYLDALVLSGLIQTGSVSVGIDVGAQAAWLEARGTDTSKMSEQQLREAATGSEVFLSAALKPLDAIEDVTIPIMI